ncbi:MAG TPA: tRNA lysidine(34) synthetase TilS [Syntrophorhabdaceae bacterium]|nr:tRNA lysidine(34) synthetase TilS [Syntrophorhabdaceae bacterium]
MDLAGNILKLIKKEGLIIPGDRVLLGFSGGIDSATLLSILLEVRKELPFDLAIAHINHLLRKEESDRDEEFARQAALQHGLLFFLKREDAKEYALSKGLSVQHAGRDIRYCFFDETAQREGYTKIAVAHNLDDQVETFLMRVIKGTGIRGLSSIPLARGRIIRPLLYTCRSDISAYAASRPVLFVQDSSNDKTVYERNFIRHRIIPLMSELNPAFRGKVISLLADLTEINRLFDDRKHSFLGRHARKGTNETTVKIGALKDMDKETLFRVLSDVITSFRPLFIPLREHIRLIENMISSDRPNLRLSLPSSLLVRKTYDRLVFSTKPLPLPIAQAFPVHEGRNPIAPLDVEIILMSSEKRPSSYPKSASTAYFDLDKLGALTVRTFLDGDRFRPLGMKEPLKLKDFFIARKVPIELRRKIPLLLSGDSIIWVAGHRIDERYKIDENTKRVLKVTLRTLKVPGNENNQGQR